MKILKYKKLKGNTYQVDLDTESIILYDDVIIKYNLLLKKTIRKEELEEIKKTNNELESYYVSLKWISRKMRTEKEIKEYLKKKDFDGSSIRKTLEKLKKEGLLNEKKYIEAYINDTIRFKSDGPKKIIQDLEKRGLETKEIERKLEEIEADVWQEKIRKIIKKKISSNHKESTNTLKRKISNYLMMQGYDSYKIEKELSSIVIKQEDNIIRKEKEKLIHKLSRKYDGSALNYQLKNKLYQKGFTKEEVEAVLKEE